MWLILDADENEDFQEWKTMSKRISLTTSYVMQYGTVIVYKHSYFTACQKWNTWLTRERNKKSGNATKYGPFSYHRGSSIAVTYCQAFSLTSEVMILVYTIIVCLKHSLLLQVFICPNCQDHIQIWTAGISRH